MYLPKVLHQKLEIFVKLLVFIIKSLVTRCKICSLIAAEVTRCKKSLVTLAKFARYLLQNLLVAKNLSLLVAKFACYSSQKLLFAKNYVSLFMKKTPGTNIYLKPVKIGEFFLFILYFQLSKNRERFRIIKLAS